MQTAAAFAAENDLLFMETSAMRATNVKEIFEAIGIFFWQISDIFFLRNFDRSSSFFSNF